MVSQSPHQITSVLLPSVENYDHLWAENLPTNPSMQIFQSHVIATKQLESVKNICTTPLPFSLCSHCVLLSTFSFCAFFFQYFVPLSVALSPLIPPCHLSASVWLLFWKTILFFSVEFLHSAAPCYKHDRSSLPTLSYVIASFCPNQRPSCADTITLLLSEWGRKDSRVLASQSRLCWSGSLQQRSAGT